MRAACKTICFGLRRRADRGKLTLRSPLDADCTDSEERTSGEGRPAPRDIVLGRAEDAGCRLSEVLSQVGLDHLQAHEAALMRQAALTSAPRPCQPHGLGLGRPPVSGGHGVCRLGQYIGLLKTLPPTTTAGAVRLRTTLPMESGESRRREAAGSCKSTSSEPLLRRSFGLCCL